jgi:hypothetical protein
VLILAIPAALTSTYGRRGVLEQPCHLGGAENNATPAMHAAGIDGGEVAVLWPADEAALAAA